MDSQEHTDPIRFSRYRWFDPGEEEVFSLKHPPQKIMASYATLRRCALEGMQGPAPERAYLRVCIIPSCRAIGTSVEEYRRFIRAMNTEGESET